MASKHSTSSAQLSWLDLVEPQEAVADDLTYREKDFLPSSQYPHMPEYIVLQKRWADGDTSPAALERLAHLCIGDPDTFKDSNGDVYKYYGVTSAVIGSKVWVAFRFDKRLARHISHATDEEEC